MLSITSRILREVSFDPAGNRFLGRVELAFQDDADEPPHLARLIVHAALPTRARYQQIEETLIAEAERELRLRLARLHPGPLNIFADPVSPGKMAA